MGQTMGQTIAQSLVEEGIEIGLVKGFEIGLAKGFEIGLANGIEIGLAKGFEIGRLNTLRELIVHFGEKRLGGADPSVMSKLQSITDIARLRRLVDKVSEVTTWDELLRD